MAGHSRHGHLCCSVQASQVVIAVNTMICNLRSREAAPRSSMTGQCSPAAGGQARPLMTASHLAPVLEQSIPTMGPCDRTTTQSTPELFDESSRPNLHFRPMKSQRNSRLLALAMTIGIVSWNCSVLNEEKHATSAESSNSASADGPSRSSPRPRDGGTEPCEPVCIQLDEGQSFCTEICDPMAGGFEECGTGYSCNDLNGGHAYMSTEGKKVPFCSIPQTNIKCKQSIECAAQYKCRGSK